MKKINFKALPDKSTPINPTNLNTMQNNIEEEINLKEDRMEVITNVNGTAIKYSNGIMICYKTENRDLRKIGGQPLAGLSVYVVENIGFASEFIEEPNISTSIKSNQGYAWLGDCSISQNRIRQLVVYSTSSNDVLSSSISIQAIGRWK